MRLRRHCASILGVAALILAACAPADSESESRQAGEQATEAPVETGIVQVIARDFAFDAPDELRPGWTTFRLTNEGAQEHFMSISRLPEGKTMEDYASVSSAFDLTPYSSGEMDRGQFLGHVVSLIPEWFGQVVSAGGPGLVAPGKVSETTVLLEPGTYVAECYVKTPDGQFHVDLGMLHQLTVKGERTAATQPEYDIDMTLTNYEISWTGELTAGWHTARIQYVDDPEGFFKHDVHLVRLNGASVDDVVPWMDWIDGLVAPAPAEFDGGSEKLPAGSTAYFTFELEPGTYAWISEGYAAQGMVSTFTVE